MALPNAKYAEIVAVLMKEILDGRFASGAPSVVRIMKRFSVARATAVRALDELKKKGLVTSRPGRGTFLTREGKSRKIGLVVPALAGSEYAPAIVGAVSHLARVNGYVLLLTDLSSLAPADQAQQVRAFASELVAQRVAGVLYQPLENFPDAERWNREITGYFTQAGIPVVLFGCDVSMPPNARSGYDVVGIDNADAGRSLVRHLFDVGARKIHFLMRPNCASAYYDRLEGVATAVRDAGGSFVREVNVLVADPADVRAVKRHLRRERPDAFICGSDTLAGYFRQTLEQVGLTVPKDMLLAGFNDLQVARLLSPPLTTVHQPCDEVAATAFRFLQERMAGRNPSPRKCLLNAPLVVRASSWKKAGAGRCAL